jgi:hypothetical protein
MPAAIIEDLISAIGIDPVAQTPSSGLATTLVDGVAACAVDADAEPGEATARVAVGPEDGVAAEQPTTARDRAMNHEARGASGVIRASNDATHSA